MSWIDEAIKRLKGSYLDVASMVEKLLKLPQHRFEED